MRRIFTLTGAKNFDISLHCLQTAVERSGLDLLSVLDDGTLTAEQRRDLEGVGNVEIISREKADQIVEPALCSYPELAGWRRNYLAIRKMFDPYLIGGEARTDFIDSDICFIRTIGGFFEPLSSPVGHMRFMCQDFNLGRLGFPDGNRVVENMNVGVISGRWELDLDFVKSLWSGMNATGFAEWHVEQGVWMRLAARMPSVQLYDYGTIRCAAMHPAFRRGAAIPRLIHSLRCRFGTQGAVHYVGSSMRYFGRHTGRPECVEARLVPGRVAPEYVHSTKAKRTLAYVRSYFYGF